MNPKTLEKLTKIMMMTSSDQEGQVLAALNRANAILTAEGASWYDVLGTDGAGITQEQMERLYNEGYKRGYEEGQLFERGQRPRASWKDWQDLGQSTFDLEKALKRCEHALNYGFCDFSDFEEEFIASFRDRFALYEEVRISPRQQAVWNKIVRKLDREGVT